MFSLVYALISCCRESKSPFSGAVLSWKACVEFSWTRPFLKKSFLYLKSLACYSGVSFKAGKSVQQRAQIRVWLLKNCPTQFIVYIRTLCTGWLEPSIINLLAPLQEDLDNFSATMQNSSVCVNVFLFGKVDCVARMWYFWSLHVARHGLALKVNYIKTQTAFLESGLWWSIYFWGGMYYELTWPSMSSMKFLQSPISCNLF